VLLTRRGKQADGEQTLIDFLAETLAPLACSLSATLAALAPGL
jgi:hypothetical protein